MTTKHLWVKISFVKQSARPIPIVPSGDPIKDLANAQAYVESLSPQDRLGSGGAQNMHWKVELLPND